MANNMHSSSEDIKSWFVIREIPFGAAPVHIKDQWLHIPLPLRYDRVPEAADPCLASNIRMKGEPGGIYVVSDAIHVRTLDAIRSLILFEQFEAAEFWNDWSLGTYGDYHTLTFRRHEGELIPPSLLRMLLPGIENFDQIQI